MKAIVLAAGLSRRMKRQKMLLPFAGGTILSTVLAGLSDARFERVLLVSSQDTLAAFELLHPGLLTSRKPELVVVVNDQPEAGQSTSLRRGLTAAGDGDFCVVLGDLPLVTGRHYRTYAGRFLERPQGTTALVPRRGTALGHPAFFSPIWRSRFASAGGDVGGRSIVRAHEREVFWTEGEDAFFRDVDTACDYEAIVQNDKTRGYNESEADDRGVCDDAHSL